MMVEMQEFMNEQTQALADQAQRFRKNPERFMRKALVDSAEGLKSLKRPVRIVAHSGVKLTVISRNALGGLIELQSEVLTSALSGAAMRLERAAEADGVADLVLKQVEMLRATRERLVDEATRAAEIFKDTGRELRNVATHLYETVLTTAEEELPRAKPRARKAKRAVRKTATRARRSAA